MTAIIKLSDVVLPNIPGKPYKHLSEFQEPSFPFGVPVASYLFSESEVDSLVNLSNPDLPLIKNGSPNFGVNGITVNGANYLNTQLAQKTAYTCIAYCQVIKAADANARQLLFTNFLAGTGNVGQSFGFTNTNQLVAYEENTSGAAMTKAQDISALSTDSFAVFACRVRADGRVKLFAKQGDLSIISTESSTTTRNPVDARTMLIGAGYASSSYLGSVTIKSMAVFHDAYAELLDEEILENMTYLEGAI